MPRKLENMYSRGNPITDKYRENHERIFGKKELPVSDEKEINDKPLIPVKA